MKDKIRAYFNKIASTRIRLKTGIAEAKHIQHGFCLNIMTMDDILVRPDCLNCMYKLKWVRQ